VDQHFKELGPGTASGQWKLSKLPYNQMSFDIWDSSNYIWKLSNCVEYPVDHLSQWENNFNTNISYNRLIFMVFDLSASVRVMMLSIHPLSRYV